MRLQLTNQRQEIEPRGDRRSWRFTRLSLPDVKDFAPVLTPIGNPIEAAAFIGEGLLDQRLGHVPARFCAQDLLGNTRENAIVENAHQVFGLRHLRCSETGRTLVTNSRSGNVFLLSCGTGMSRGARMNEWHVVAQRENVSVEAKSLMWRKSGGLTMHECSALRALCPTPARSAKLLAKLRTRAVAFVDLTKVLWFPSREGWERTTDGRRETTHSIYFESFRTPDGLMRLRNPRMAKELQRQWAESLDGIGPLANAWCTTNAANGFERLEQLLECLVKALAMANGTLPETVRMSYATTEQSGVVWYAHDPQPLTQFPITGLPDEAQYDGDGLCLKHGVATLLRKETDPKANAVWRSLRHIYHAHEGRYLEQHVLSVCLAIEELATAIQVKLDSAFRDKALRKFERRESRKPSEDELVLEALQSKNDWLQKIDYLQGLFPRVRFPDAHREASRKLRNGIIHTGRLLPDEETALATLPELERYWHKVAWLICGIELRKTNVGTFHSRDDGNEEMP
jgi:hypothetical protein